MSKALDDVRAERRRQLEAEGWTPRHDDEHRDGDLATAAACYAMAQDASAKRVQPPGQWPWSGSWWKPKDRRRNLVRAAALLLAEIERMDRVGEGPEAARSARVCQSIPTLHVGSLVRRLIRASQGRAEWRVQSPDGVTYCMAFDERNCLDPRLSACAWLADHRLRFPESPMRDYIVAQVRVRDGVDFLLAEAADALSDGRGELSGPDEILRQCSSGAMSCCERAGEFIGYGPNGRRTFHCESLCACHD